MNDDTSGSGISLHDLMDQIPDAFFVHDMDGRILLVNEGACRSLGYSRQEILGLTIFDLAAEAGPDEIRVAWKSLAEGNTVTVESPLRMKDGTVFPAEIRETPLKGGDRLLAVGFAADISERKEREDAAGRDSDLIRRMMDTSPAGIVRVGVDGRVVFANAKAEALLGLELSTAEKRAYNDPAWRITDFDGNPFPEADLPFSQVSRSKEAVADVRHAIEWPDGQRVLLSINAAPLFDADGEFDGIVASLQDITDQARWERALAESEDRFRSVFEGSPMGILLYELREDDRLVLIAVNPACDTILGIDCSLLLGKTIEEAFPPLADTEVPLRYRLAARDGIPWQTEEIQYQDDSIRGAYEVFAFQISEGRVAVMFLDISERKKWELEVRQKEQALDTSISAFAMASTEGQLSYVNPAFLSMWGYDDVEQVLGRSALEFWTSPESAAPVLRAVQRGEDWVGQLTARRADGSAFQIQLAATPVLDEQGEPLGIQASFLDITRRKEAEEDRERLEAQLRQAQKMEAVGQLAGGVAHDFNNLLQVINGYAGLALEGVHAEHPAREHLEAVLAAGEKAGELVQQLLVFSRKQIIHPTHLNLNDLIVDLLKMLGRVIGEHIRLGFVPGHGLGTVYADRGMVEQVLLNLCVNARDAMPDGGDLTIETRSVVADDAFRDSHPWATAGCYALISVADSGSGMDPATLERIFEPFFSTKNPTEGTGLGLATVYGIIKQHGGTIEAYSEPGQGATFKIYLPISEQLAEQAGPEIPQPSRGGQETLLVAEDDQMVLSLITEILAQAGYNILTAPDGRQAVAVFREHKEDVNAVILDVVMPVLGGRDAHDQIKEIDPAVRVLFASGYSDNAIHTDFVLQEGFRVIQKPFNREELLRAVRDVLDG